VFAVDERPSTLPQVKGRGFHSTVLVRSDSPTQDDPSNKFTGGHLSRFVNQPVISALSFVGPEANPPDMDYESALRYTRDVAALRGRLSIADPNSCYTALFHLCQLGDAAKAALPELKCLLLATSHPILRMNAASVIAEIAPEECSLVLPVLIAGIDDPDESVVQQAAFGLGSLGTAAAAAIPLLKQILAKSGGFVQIAVAKALVSIAAEEHDFVLPILIRFLQDLDEVFHDSVIEILGQIGPKAESTVLLLREFVSSTKDSRAQAASIALGKITGDWAAAYTLGIRLVRSPESLYDFVPRDNWESFGFEALSHWELLGIHARGGITLLEKEYETATEPIRYLIEDILNVIGHTSDPPPPPCGWPA